MGNENAGAVKPEIGSGPAGDPGAVPLDMDGLEAPNIDLEDYQRKVSKYIAKRQAEKANDEGKGKNVPGGVRGGVLGKPGDAEPENDLEDDDPEPAHADVDTGGTKKPAATQPDPNEWFNEDLQARAEAAGIGLQDAIEYGGAKALRNAIKHVTALREQYAKKTPADPGADAAKKPDPAAGEFQIGLSEDYDEGIRKAFSELNDHYQGKIKALDERVSQLVQANQIQAHETIVDEFEGMISGLDEKFQPLFGKGAVDDLPEKSKELQNRVNLFRDYQALRQGYVDGKRPKSSELFKKALNAAYGEEIQKMERSQLRQKAKALEGRTLNRPTHQDPAGPTPRRSAEAFAAAKLREYGVGED